MKVLLVEDNRADARLFVELVSEVPHRELVVTVVGTLADAKAQLADHQVVFLDLSLPDAHGIATLVELVSCDRTRPIVVLTGNEDDTVAVEAMKRGAQDFLRKGEITPALIARAARYAVERKAAEEGARQLAAAERQATTAQFLGAVTAAAMSTLDRTQSLVAVARAVVPTLADCCVIDVVAANNKLERLAYAGATPADEAFLASYVSKLVPGESHPNSPVLDAIAERKTIVIRHFDPTALAPPDSEYVARVRSFGVHSMLVVPLVARDRVVGAVSYGMTSSARGYDDELRLLAEQVSDRVALAIDNATLYHQAQRAISGRDELLAVVSHDLRNPLGVVGLALQMVAQDPASLPLALPRAQRAVDRMVRLIDDLLDLARIDAGTLAVDPKPVEVSAILDDLIEQQRPLALAKRIDLDRQYTGLGIANVDRHRLGQALSNLIGNSLKLTPAGGRITVSAERERDQLVLAVCDTGPGIAPEHRDRMFDRFWQPKQRRDGVGLGLAIVKGIVDAHGGTIEVDSALGQGATFRIVIPADGVPATRTSATDS